MGKIQNPLLVYSTYIPEFRPYRERAQLTQLPLLLQMAENQYIYLNSDPTGNELNSVAKVAAQIVLGLVILIITLLLSLPRFQRVKLVLELISEAVGTLFRIVGLFQRLIRDLHQIISMAHDGFQVVSFLELIVDVVGSLVSLVDQLKRLIRTCREIRGGARGGREGAIAPPDLTQTPPP